MVHRWLGELDELSSSSSVSSPSSAIELVNVAVSAPAWSLRMEADADTRFKLAVRLLSEEKEPDETMPLIEEEGIDHRFELGPDNLLGS